MKDPTGGRKETLDWKNQCACSSLSLAPVEVLPVAPSSFVTPAARRMASAAGPFDAGDRGMASSPPPDRAPVLNALRLQRTPVSDDVRPVAVNLQPGDRLVQRGAVQHASLRARRRLELEQPRLHRHDVLQALDVAPRDRQHPDLDAPLERICREARPTTGKPQRMQQRAGQDGVGQRVGRRLESRAIAIQRRDRAPQRVGR